MRTRRPSLWLLLAALTTAPAAADAPRTLYVKAKNTHVKASASPTADTLRVLQPGQPVAYQGREGTTPWHRVTVTADKGALQGFVYQANLSSTPPSLEVVSKDPRKPLSSEAFASSGAAFKGLGPGTLEYGKSLERPESTQQLVALQKLAARVTDAQVADYARAGGLPEVVGSSTARRAARGSGKSTPSRVSREAP